MQAWSLEVMLFPESVGLKWREMAKQKQPTSKLVPELPKHAWNWLRCVLLDALTNFWHLDAPFLTGLLAETMSTMLAWGVYPQACTKKGLTVEIAALLHNKLQCDLTETTLAFAMLTNKGPDRSKVVVDYYDVKGDPGIRFSVQPVLAGCGHIRTSSGTTYC